MKINFIALSLFISIFSFSQGIDTQNRDDAGASGAGIQSGFYQTSNPINFPKVAQPTEWWHLLDIRHTESSNNFAMQFSGSFFNHDLYFRKTQNIATQPWRKILMENPLGNVGIGIDLQNPESRLEVGDINGATLSLTTNRRYGTAETPLLMKINFLGSANTKKASIVATEQSYATRASKLSFFVNDGTSDNSLQEMMTILNNGNVGIGTTNPQTKLEVDFKNEQKSIKFFQPATNSNPINSLISSLMFKWFNNHADIGIIRGDSDNITGLAFRFNGDEKIRFTPSGNASFLGKIEAKEVKVTTTPTADFVFAEDYNLPKLEAVEKHIKEKKHLPEIASAKEMEKEGVNVGEFQIKLLQKIEELTLYSIEQNKRIKNLEEKLLKNNK